MTRKMKDSGIEWIGEIPEDWETASLSKIALIKTGSTPDKKLLSDVGEIDWVKTNNLKEEKGITFSDLKIKYKNKKFVTIAREGATLVSCIGDIGKMAFLYNEVSYNQQINAVSFNNSIHPKFGFYLLFSQKEQHKSYSNGNVLQILNSVKQGQVKVAYPWLNNQKKISDILDKKTEQIESIKFTITKEIQTLENYRKSVITEAVTKGLDPNAEMKDSGVEWIGEIPKHWHISKIKHQYIVTLGKMIQAEQKTSDDTLENYLSSVNLKWCGVDTSVLKKMWISKKEKEVYLLNEGDILISEGGMAGTTSIYNNEFYPCYIQNAVNRVASKGYSTNKFLYYWMYFVYRVGYIESICNKATIRHYTKEKVENTPLTHMDLNEEKKIVDYLDKKTRVIDEAISAKRKQLDVLEEYKKSLIYEYVTGKKEVHEC